MDPAIELQLLRQRLIDMTPKLEEAKNLFDLTIRELAELKESLIQMPESDTTEQRQHLYDSSSDTYQNKSKKKHVKTLVSKRILHAIPFPILGYGYILSRPLPYQYVVHHASLHGWSN